MFRVCNKDKSLTKKVLRESFAIHTQFISGYAWFSVEFTSCAATYSPCLVPLPAYALEGVVFPYFLRFSSLIFSWRISMKIGKFLDGQPCTTKFYA
jgi:hypothetical protein